ncbi:MAG: elongation factor G [Acidobacteria bacterium]|nr:MAG: translation elongation factor G [Acidobacteria bacterium 13_2_20CM_58_27]PYT69390.1 MAG: elongation factor G [Acidobacteriota bacterium]PYT86304.1 MAG: elongation factor G [Acidobacteriota bacterium]
MKCYLTKDIRNVGIVGHGGTGKTQLVSSLLYAAGMTPRWGKVADGSATTDWDDEEVARKISIQAGLAYAEWPATPTGPSGSSDKVKINFIDLPGYSTFITETKASLIAADAALIAVDAHVGVQVTTEKVWDYATEYDIPRAFVLTWMDRELSSFERSLDSLTEVFGRDVVALQLPIGSEKGFRGVIDLVAMKAHTYKPDGDGKATIEEIPGALADEAKEAHEKLVEMIAEGDDAMMEEFFREGTIPIHDLIPAVRKAIVAEKIFPVLMTSALHNIGTASLLTFLADAFPHPDEHAQVGYKDPGGKGDRVERKYDDAQPVSLFVFKTLADPFAGRINYFKVKSGVLKNDATLQNYNRNVSERLQHIQVVQGKQLTETGELHAGDIGAIAKLKETTTGETLGDKAAPIYYTPARLPEPSITFAIEPKSRADEDKIGVAIHKILEEDGALRFSRDAQTKEFLLAGSGQQHIEVVVAKLQKRYNVNLTLKPPKVPYRETIRGKADAEGKHKKQSGGHGQFGVCRIKMEPVERGKGIEFVDDIFGGAIPKNWIPSVEKGIRDSAARGYLAGFPVTDFRAILYDGKYHDVDSSDIAFKIAGSLAFKEAMKQARPALLEPIMNVEVYAPDQYSGDLMGDLSSRRGRISGSETRGHNVIIKGQVPLAEMLSYATDLTSKTQGRASYSMEFSHYDYVPNELAEKVIAAHKAAHGEALVEEEA